MFIKTDSLLNSPLPLDDRDYTFSSLNNNYNGKKQTTPLDWTKIGLPILSYI